MKWFVCLALCCTALAAAPPGASAAVHTGTAEFEAPTDTPSLNPRPPITQRGQYLKRMGVAYDDSGQLAIELENYDASYHGASGRLTFKLYKHCAQGERPTISGEFSINPGFQAEPPTSYASFRRQGFDGAAPGVVTFDGTSVRAVFNHPQLAGLTLRCFAEQPEETTVIELSGYEPAFFLSKSAATEAVRASINAKYSGSEDGDYLRCPEEHDEKVFCRAQFRVGSAWRFQVIQVSARDYQAVIKTSFSRTWTRKLRRCAYGKAWRYWRRYATGTLRSNSFLCDWQQAGDVDYDLTHHRRKRFISGVHGTGTGLYLPLFRYRCVRRGRSATCTNGMGDKFVYARRK